MTKTLMGLSLALLAALATATVIAGCGDDDENDAAGHTKEEGILLVGSAVPHPPFEQGEPPRYTGFDIDLINAIAKRLDLTTRIRDTSFDTIFADQEAGKFDLVASAALITQARSKRVTFSGPYYNAEQSLAVRTDSDIVTTDDLPGKTVAVVEGTAGQDYAEEETDATVRAYPEIADALDALNGREVDGVINDFAVSAFALRKYPRLDIAQRISTFQAYGFAMRKTNTGLIDAVNGALSDVIDDGTYKRIFEKWFDEKPPLLFRPAE